jgi:DNA-binding HxlR family transcriptional regulator
MTTTAHPYDELLIVLGRPAVMAVLWGLRDGPMRAAGDDAAEQMEELRRNELVAPGDGDDPLWQLTPDGRALADQLFALATWARRRGV